MWAWYLLHCKARQEARARMHVENQGYTACLPQLDRTKLVRGKRTVCEEPLFPNYLFVQLNVNTANFNALRSTRGVNGFVRFGGVPATVPNEVVAQLLEIEDAQKNAASVQQTYKTGAAVEITEGPFAGLQAVYQMPKGEERCLVLLDMLGKQQRIEIEERVLRSS